MTGSPGFPHSSAFTAPVCAPVCDAGIPNFSGPAKYAKPIENRGCALGESDI